MNLRILLIVATSLLLLACGSAKEEVDVTADWSAEMLYRSAKSELNKENYLTAIEKYEILESRYPFGKFATQAQLDVGYAYYKYDEPDAAIAAIDRFIKLNPRHEGVDRADDGELRDRIRSVGQQGPTVHVPGDPRAHRRRPAADHAGDADLRFRTRLRHRIRRRRCPGRL